MHKLIDTSTATRPTGSPPHRKLFRVPDGIFKGRLVALFADSAPGISIAYSDNPYDSWQTPVNIISDSGDTPFSADMDKNGNIRIVYSDTSGNINYLKLSFTAGTWNAGTPVTVVNVDNSYNPYILKDSDGKLWCFFVNHQISSDQNYYVRAKVSSDGGQNWGSGALDLGDQLSPASTDLCYVSARQISSKIFSVYCYGRSNLAIKPYDFDQGSWGSESAIYTGDFIDDNFDIDVSPDKKLGAAFCVSSISKIYFKEFDGAFWSGLYEVESGQTRSPQISYSGHTPSILYTRTLTGSYKIIRSAIMSGGEFIASDYSLSMGAFNKVILFDHSALDKYYDATIPASDSTSADVFHPTSTVMVGDIDDCLFLGKGDKFFCAAVLLSTPGSGGQVVWEYCDGFSWIAFTPATGANNLDSGDSLIRFWDDINSSPDNWQIANVNGQNAYWIRARVISSYTTAPIGSQIKAAFTGNDLVIARDGN